MHWTGWGIYIYIYIFLGNMATHTHTTHTPTYTPCPPRFDTMRMTDVGKTLTFPVHDVTK